MGFFPHRAGPSGDFSQKVDASGSPSKGKGVFAFTKKYGANVDGYSPIYTPEEWSTKGGTYEGGKFIRHLNHALLHCSHA